MTPTLATYRCPQCEATTRQQSAIQVGHYCPKRRHQWIEMREEPG